MCEIGSIGELIDICIDGEGAIFTRDDDGTSRDTVYLLVQTPKRSERFDELYSEPRGQCS